MILVPAVVVCSTAQLRNSAANGRANDYEHWLDNKQLADLQEDGMHVLELMAVLDHDATGPHPIWVRSIVAMQVDGFDEDVDERFDIRLRDWLALPAADVKREDVDIWPMQVRAIDIRPDKLTPWED